MTCPPHLLVSWYCSRWSSVSERDSLLTSATLEFSGREDTSFVSLLGNAMRMLRGGRIGGVGTRSGKEERKGTVIPAWQFDLLPLTHKQGRVCKAGAVTAETIPSEGPLLSELESSGLDTGPALFSGRGICCLHMRSKPGSITSSKSV